MKIYLKMKYTPKAVWLLLAPSKPTCLFISMQLRSAKGISSKIEYTPLSADLVLKDAPG